MGLLYCDGGKIEQAMAGSEVPAAERAAVSCTYLEFSMFQISKVTWTGCPKILGEF